MSRARRRSCASSSWMPAITIWISQTTRIHGNALNPGTRGITRKLPRVGPCHARFECLARIACGEEGPDPARLVVAQMDDHREALLLLAAEAVVQEDRSANHQRILCERLDLLGARARAVAVADVAHPVAQTLVAGVEPAFDAERDRVDLDLWIRVREDRLRALAVPDREPRLLVGRRRHGVTICDRPPQPSRSTST